MKATITFIMLWVIITVSVAVQGQEYLVKDIKGKPIKAGSPYYIKPASEYFGPGVWVSFFRPREETPCPQLAVLSGNPFISPREPVVIIPDSSSRHDLGYVYESTKLRLKFQRMDGFCPDQTGVWDFIESSEYGYTLISGTGTLTSGKLFNIMKSRRGYLLHANGQDIRIREFLPIREQEVYYLEYTGPGDFFEVNFVPVNDPWNINPLTGESRS